MAAKLGVPHHYIKKLANHSGRDLTDTYIHFHPENLRDAMQQITTRFVELMGATVEEVCAIKGTIADTAPFVTLKEVLAAYLVPMTWPPAR